MTATALGVSPADRASHQPTGRQLYLILGGLMSGLFLASLDQTVVATALPTIAGDLKGADLLSWVVTVYLLTSTATAPLYGKIGDIYGRKRIYQVAIVIFLVASVLCALAQSMGQLIVFRGLQGIGAGGITTLTFAVIGDLVPLRERGRYQGWFGSVFLVASIVGPVLGGFCVDHLTWQWVFWINLPLGLVTVAITQRLLRLPAVRRDHSIDWTGAVLVMAGISAILIAAQSGGKDWAWGSADSVGLFGAGVVLLAVFVAWELRVAEPLLPMKFFRNRNFAIANAMGFLAGIIMFGAMVFLPQYLQLARGIKATESGLRTFPLLVGVLIGSVSAGRYISATGRYRAFPIAGSLVAAIGLGLLSRLTAHSSLTFLGVAMAVFGAGLGLTLQTLVLVSQNSVSHQDIGVATSTVTFLRTMGGSVGASVIGALLLNGFRSNLEHRSGQSLPITGSTSVLSSPAHVQGLPPATHELVVGSFSDALSRSYLYAIPVAAVAFVLSLFIRQTALRARDDGTEPGGTDGTGGTGGTDNAEDSPMIEPAHVL
jgi:EmrB/QacA subfamily drug resistance transporter